MPLIGRGAFSKVYKKDSKTVIIVSRDKAKVAMASPEWPRARCFPKLIEKADGLYECKYYEPVRALKSNLGEDQWALYKALRDVFHNGAQDYWHLRSCFWALKGWKAERRALLSALDVLSEYGRDVRFEISPRNVAVHRGRLILLDCFFFQGDLLFGGRRRW